jgi:hypothetical protein
MAIPTVSHRRQPRQHGQPSFPVPHGLFAITGFALSNWKLGRFGSAMNINLPQEM